MSHTASDLESFPEPPHIVVTVDRHKTMDAVIITFQAPSGTLSGTTGAEVIDSVRQFITEQPWPCCSVQHHSPRTWGDVKGGDTGGGPYGN